MRVPTDKEIEEGVCYVYNIEHYICNANHD